ncbi:MAG: hypothetical protein ABI277_12925 [Burkholderiaceae bacterium]
MAGLEGPTGLLVATGVGNTFCEMAVQAHLSPILLAWLVAAMIRAATVATITGAGFWLVKQDFSLVLAETLETWTALETVISIVGIALIMLLSIFV